MMTMVMVVVVVLFVVVMLMLMVIVGKTSPILYTQLPINRPMAALLVVDPCRKEELTHKIAA